MNGILAALLARVHTGRGQYVETSLFESALALSVWETTEYWATGRAPAAMGSAHRLNAPYQAFRTSNGFVNVAALTPAQWAALCRVIDRPALVDDSRYRDNAMRVANRATLAAEIEAALIGASTETWVERLLAAGVPAGPILDLEQALADPHTHARRMIEPVEHPAAGRVRTLGFPVKLSDTPMRVRRPPPQLNEHAREIRQEAGLEEA